MTAPRDHGAARERLAVLDANPLVAALVDQLGMHPRSMTDPLLNECVARLRDGRDPVEIIAATLLAYAEDRARLLALATRASMLDQIRAALKEPRR
jgi:hypothetical protein